MECKNCKKEMEYINSYAGVDIPIEYDNEAIRIYWCINCGTLSVYKDCYDEPRDLNKIPWFIPEKENNN